MALKRSLYITPPPGHKQTHNGSIVVDLCYSVRDNIIQRHDIAARPIHFYIVYYINMCINSMRNFMHTCGHVICV